ncbi:hypothetical protein [Streptomyces cinnamoneus]|uniref:Uncharacterized protein n=1 Tax=Streptomyces cinnamoneus TaxID=53446 RepID=A0A918WEC1_STRCJ|nr:hypothetical protein [Streptomyces cinnamoneus]GHC34149.1 hypothetical protein GCM10010507_03580 [Streptomyces cinnamoneus]
MRIDPARALGAYVRAEAYRIHRPDPEPEPAPVIVEERPDAPLAEESADRSGFRRPGVLARLLLLRRR